MQLNNRRFVDEVRADLKITSIEEVEELPAVGHIPHNNLYNILNNEEYVLQLAYISPSLSKKMREMMINDDDVDESNDFVQSDKTTLLINLGYLPPLAQEKFKMSDNPKVFASETLKRSVSKMALE